MGKNKELFFVFIKIGAFTFGGGYAMIPLIKREIVEEKKWLTNEEVMDIVAIAESTPGPLAVNTATFVGSRIAGFKGALLSTLGVVLPSFVIIAAISRLLTLVEHLEAVQYAFNGIRAGVLVLIASAFTGLFRQVHKDLFAWLLMGAAFFASLVLKVNTILILLLCAVFGLCRTLWTERRSRR